MNNNIYGSEEVDTSKLSNDDTLRIIHASVVRHVDELEDGDRIKMQDLMDKVAAETKIRTTTVEAFVPAFAYSLPNAHVKKGRGGGVIKGPRIVRVDSRPRCPTCHQVDRNAASHAEASVPQSKDMIVSATPIAETTQGNIANVIPSIPDEINAIVFEEDETNE